MILAQGNSNEDKTGFLDFAITWLSDYWWLVLSIAGACYFVAALRYWWRSRNVDNKIRLHLSEIKGKIPEDLGQAGIERQLFSHITDIASTFRKATQSQSSVFAAEAINSKYFSFVVAQANTSQGDIISEIEDESLVVPIGPGKIDVIKVIRLLRLLFHVLPVPFRKRYMASLINVSLVTSEGQAQLQVYRSGKEWTSLTTTAELGTMTECTDLLRDAAFMILQLHGVLEGRNWLSMRRFADGLDTLDEYHNKNDAALLDKAKEGFDNAVAADPGNYPAAYIYAYMLLFERTRESIDKAAKLLEQALKTEDLKLKALVHASLAFCYAQRYHRLAKRKTDVLEQAHTHAKLAHQNWHQAASSEESAPPLILYTLALAHIVDEGADRSDEDVKQRFLYAAQCLLQAIESESDNGIFHNVLGWLFLKLAQRNIETLTEHSPDYPLLEGNTAEKSEYFLLRSLDLKKENKLVHANLCLLYATSRFTQEDKRAEYIVRCRHHGMRAIQLDPNYINGNRDLALSLIRYGEYKEAEKYYNKALLLAKEPDKDLEIMHDIEKTLNGVGADENVVWTFKHPDPHLLEPPG